MRLIGFLILLGTLIATSAAYASKDGFVTITTVSEGPLVLLNYRGPNLNKMLTPIVVYIFTRSKEKLNLEVIIDGLKRHYEVTTKLESGKYLGRVLLEKPKNAVNLPKGTFVSVAVSRADGAITSGKSEQNLITVTLGLL